MKQFQRYAGDDKPKTEATFDGSHKTNRRAVVAGYPCEIREQVSGNDRVERCRAAPIDDLGELELRVDDFRGNKLHSRKELVRLERKEIPDGIFEVPADFHPAGM